MTRAQGLPATQGKIGAGAGSAQPEGQIEMSARLAVPTNITLLPLPPRSPEINPIGNF
jgi:hypothetical protein